MSKDPSVTARPGAVVLAFITVYIVWGSTYFFIRQALSGFPPLMLGAFRFIVAGLIMMAWSLFKKENIFHPKAIKTGAISGFIILFLGNGIVIYTEQFVSSAWVAIIISVSPIWFVLFDKPHWKENAKSRSIIAGLIMGIVGIILLFSENIQVMKGNDSRHQTLAFFSLILASMCWVIGSLYTKYSKPQFPSAVNSSWQMLFAGIFFLICAGFDQEYKNFHLSQVPTLAWASLSYLVIFGSIVGYSCYIWLMQVRNPAQVSTYAYVNPVVAVLLGVFFGAEHISLMQVSGLVVVLVSVLLINLNKYLRRKVVS